jgi:hypothetical protein
MSAESHPVAIVRGESLEYCSQRQLAARRWLNRSPFDGGAFDVVESSPRFLSVDDLRLVFLPR